MRGHVFAVAVHPAVPHTVYAATSCGVLRSEDSGRRWFTADDGLSGERIIALQVDPGPPVVLYAFTSGALGGVFRSEDGGRTWSRLSACVAIH